MQKQTKIAVAGAGVSAAGAGVALGGESVLWSIFSAGPGAALTGVCETNAFLAWLGGGSIAAGGGGMAAGAATLAILKRSGWGLAITGAVITGIAVGRMIKRKKEEKRASDNSK